SFDHVARRSHGRCSATRRALTMAFDVERSVSPGYAAFMQSDMNFLRSSAFMPFDLVLHEAILLSFSFFLFDRHVLMNFLRSSPFFSPASLLHAFIRSCWQFSAASAGEGTATKPPNIRRCRIFFKGTPPIGNRQRGPVAARSRFPLVRRG